MAYDWRTRFGMPFRAVFDGRMTWHEACALARALAQDPTSHLGAAIAGWKHPMSREAILTADLYDLQVAVNTERNKRSQIKPYPRPWAEAANRTASEKPVVSQEQIRAALAARGH